MNTAALVSAAGSAVVALIMLASGAPKALGHKAAIERIVALKYSPAAGRAVGCVEIAGAIGVIAGFSWPIVGMLAAGGCAALMLGAIASHLRVGDPIVRALPAAVVGSIAAAVAALYYLGL